MDHLKEVRINIFCNSKQMMCFPGYYLSWKFYSLPVALSQISNGRPSTEILCSALLETIDYLRIRFQTSNMNRWLWGKLTTRVIPHSMGEVSQILQYVVRKRSSYMSMSLFVFSPTLSLGPVSSGGNGETLFPVHLPPRILDSKNPWSSRLGEPTGGVVTASARLVRRWLEWRLHSIAIVSTFSCSLSWKLPWFISERLVLQNTVLQLLLLSFRSWI